MNKNKNDLRFLQERIASLKRQLRECKQVSELRKTKSLNLITEIKKLRKLITTYRISN